MSELMNRVLTRLGVGAAPVDVDGLAAVYRAWCRSVPFDSARKRMFQAAGATGPVPDRTSEEFLESWLTTGTGGTCWSTSLGLHAVCVALGFEARLVPGVMLTDPDTRPNHGTVLVTLDGVDWLVDTSMLFDRPLELRRDAPTAHTDPVHPVDGTPTVEGWLVRWRPAHSDLVIGCEISADGASWADWDEWHDRTRGHSLFNSSLYVRRNVDHGIIAYGRGKVVTRDATGQLGRELVPADGVVDVLVDRFGYDRELASTLPPDDTGDAFL